MPLLLKTSVLIGRGMKKAPLSNRKSEAEIYRIREAARLFFLFVVLVGFIFPDGITVIDGGIALQKRPHEILVPRGLHGEHGIGFPHVDGQLISVPVQHDGSDVLQGALALDKSELSGKIFVVDDILRFDQEGDDDDGKRDADEDEKRIFEKIGEGVQSAFKNIIDGKRNAERAYQKRRRAHQKDDGRKLKTEAFFLYGSSFLFHAFIIAYKNGKIK